MLKLEPGTSSAPAPDNPWAFKRIEDFLFFLCPECNFTSQDNDEFLYHCEEHPLASQFLADNGIVDDPYMDQEDNNGDEAFEDDEWDPDVEPATFVDCNVVAEVKSELPNSWPLGL